jgi:hypothetical protein
LDGSEEGGTAKPLDSSGSLGRLVTVASGGNHGGGYARAQRRRVEGERAGELERGGKGEGGSPWRAAVAPEGVASSPGQVGGGARNLQGLHAAAYRPKEEDRNILQKAPWALEHFLDFLNSTNLA